MLEKIKERVKAWKRFYARNCQKCDENSSWYDILMELEYYCYDKFYPYSKKSIGVKKMYAAWNTIGAFTNDEKAFLETLPGYHMASNCLKNDDLLDYFRTKYSDHNDLEMFCMCRDRKVDVPIREYTIVTGRQNLWDLEIYIFKYSRYDKRCRHGIIRFAKEAPADYVEPEYADDDLPF
jgi:hypothetical protein